MSTIPPLLAVAASVFAAVTLHAADAPEVNKKAVAASHEPAINRKNFEAAARTVIKLVLADGDSVIVSVHAVREPGTRGRAIVDVFKLDDDGKLVENREVRQDVLERAAISNGMF